MVVRYKKGCLQSLSMKKFIYPWDVNGYVRLSWDYKRTLTSRLLSEHGNGTKISKTLRLPTYWFTNFTKNDKIHTKALRRIVSITDTNVAKDVVQFNDDYGSSSFPFLARFPVKYSPLWHFFFCLSVGDGCIQKGNKKRFTWYQKPEGQEKVIALLNKIGFDYPRSLKSTKQGITMPQLIRKIGAFVTGLNSSKEIKENIISASSELGRDYEVVFLCAFFMDEAGISKAKSSSEITLHQEGNLELLQRVGSLLTKLGIIWSKNKKGELWCIRIGPEGVVKLSQIFDSVKKHDVTLLHREAVFNKKVEMARKTIYKVPLRKEAALIRTYLLANRENELVSSNEIKDYFKTNFNVSSRTRKLVATMKKKKELQPIGIGQYVIRGE